MKHAAQFIIQKINNKFSVQKKIRSKRTWTTKKAKQGRRSLKCGRRYTLETESWGFDMRKSNSSNSILKRPANADGAIFRCRTPNEKGDPKAAQKLSPPDRSTEAGTTR